MNKKDFDCINKKYFDKFANMIFKYSSLLIEELALLKALIVTDITLSSFPKDDEMDLVDILLDSAIASKSEVSDIFYNRKTLTEFKKLVRNYLPKEVLQLFNDCYEVITYMINAYMNYGEINSRSKEEKKFRDDFIIYFLKGIKLLTALNKIVKAANRDISLYGKETYYIVENSKKTSFIDYVVNESVNYFNLISQVDSINDYLVDWYFEYDTQKYCLDIKYDLIAILEKNLKEIKNNE